MIQIKVEVEINGVMYGWNEEIPTGVMGPKNDPRLYENAKQALSRATLSIMRSLDAHTVDTANAKVNPDAEKRGKGPY